MNNKFIKKAINLAKCKSLEGTNGPFGALVVMGDKIIGKGWNRVVELNDPTAHAEIIAIRDACKNMGTYNLSECTIYCSCEPCTMCLGAILWARIDKIVFACSKDDAEYAGFDDKKILQNIKNGFKKECNKWIQVDREYGMTVFESWINNPNKKSY